MERLLKVAPYIYERGTILISMEGIRKGDLFYQKWYKRGKGFDHGVRASPYKTFSSAPPPGTHISTESWNEATVIGRFTHLYAQVMEHCAVKKLV